MKWTTLYAGERYTFDDERLTASEARLQKRITDGMSPVAAERARFELDPDAWTAALVIGRRRIGLDPAAAMDVDADEIDLMACMAATTNAMQPEQPEPAAKPATKPRARSRKAAEPELEPAAEPDPAT